MKQIFLILFLFFFLACDNKCNKCPIQVYTQKENLLPLEEYEIYQDYINIINHLGDFRIEYAIDASDDLNSIFINCYQFCNNLLVDHPVTFIFYTDDPVGRIKNTSVSQKEGYFYTSDMIPEDTLLPTEAKYSSDDAIQSALRKDPFERFCSYELCYHGNPRQLVLSWKLYGNLHHVYVSCETGEILAFENLIINR